MNWIQGIQGAIDYVEENIRDDIDFEKVAKNFCIWYNTL